MSSTENNISNNNIASGIVAGSGGNSTTNGNNGNNLANATIGESLRIIKTQLVPHPLTAVLQRSHSPMQLQSSITTTTTTTAITTIPISISRSAHTPTPPSSNLIAPNSPKSILNSHQIATQFKNSVNVTNLFSLNNPVAAKISHIKTTTIEHLNANVNANSNANAHAKSNTNGNHHGNGNNISLNNITMTGTGSGTIPTGTIVTSATMNTIKMGGGGGSGSAGISVTMASTIGAATPIALNTSQTNATGATSIRAIGAGGQSTQVRVVMGNLMTSSMIKQLENAAGVGVGTGRTQITTFPTTPTRSLNNTSITVTRSANQYMPRASVTATPISGVSGIPSGQRLVAPIRTAPTSVTVTGGSGSGTGVGAITATGNFVRGTSINRSAASSSSIATTVISPATTSTTWMATNPTGQVQLIRTIPTHQARGQRGATTSSVVAVTGTMVTTTTTVTPIPNGGTQSAIVTTAVQPLPIATATQHNHQQQQQGKAIIQAVSSSVNHHHSSQTQQAYVAAVLPSRQHQATLVYSSNVTATQQSHLTPGQFNSTSSASVVTAVGPRFAVASPIAATATATVVPRQLRPIPLSKPFTTTKLNTTNISIRTPNLPQLTPTITSNVTISSGAVAGAGVPSQTNSLRTITVSGGIPSGINGSSTATNVPSTNLSTTRIIQLQQQPNGTTTQQLINSTGRLATNVIQPIIVNTSGGNKFGLRPPASMAAKVQPSLTITQLGIGKLPSSSAASLAASGVVTGPSGNASVMAQHQNLLSNNNNTNSNGNGPPSISTATITATNLASNGSAQLINVSQAINGGQLMTTQNIATSSGSGNTHSGGNVNTTTVVPLAISTRGTVGMTSLKNASSGGSSGGCILGNNTATAAITVGKIMTQAQLATSLESVSNSVNSTGCSGGGSTVNPTNVFIHHSAVPQRSAPHNNANSNTVNVSVGLASSAVNSNISNLSNLTSNASNATVGAFLQPGSTIYYESLPANSVQVSTTGVLSIATTTVTSSTMALGNPIISSAAAAAAANLSISSIPIITHGANNSGVAIAGGSNTSTTTFTVVPSIGGRAIGQVQIPGSTATQIQALPVRFSQLPLLTGGGVSVANSTTTATASSVAASVAATDNMVVSQSITPQLIQQTTAISGIDSTSQIIIPVSQQQQAQQQLQNNIATGTAVSVISATAANGIGIGNNGPQAQHMLIPLQTSIKMTTMGGAGNAVGVGNSGGGVAANTNAPTATVVSNFIRKRETDGSPIRAAKNLGPTFISMGSVTSNNAPAATNCNTINNSYSLTTLSSPNTNTNTSTNSSPVSATTKASLIMDGFSKKERHSNCSSNLNNLNNNNNNNNTALGTLANYNSTSSSITLTTTRTPNINLNTNSNARITDSPTSSDGSTTVSANSSPGIDQQIQQDNNNIVINRMVVAANVTDAHFNPINELYANHHNQHQNHHHSYHHHQAVSGTTHVVVAPAAPSTARNIMTNIIEYQTSNAIQTASNPSNVNGNSMHQQQQSSSQQSQQQQRFNGSVIDCPPRKKSRRSTNDNQLSTHSNPVSLSLPPPIPTSTPSLAPSSSSASSLASSASFSSSLAIATSTAAEILQQSQCTQSTAIFKNHSAAITILSASGHQHATNDVVSLHNSTGTYTINQSSLSNSANANEGVINGKENAKPVEYILKRPRNCTLLNSYKQSWKSAHNHFQRYTDIKPKEERKPTIMDLANQANVLGKINGWKIYHLRSQMEDLCENESLGYEKLSNMLKQIESHDITNEIERISDLLKGNMQRSKIIVDGINEAQNQIMKIFDHKAHISDIISRCASKRNYKKRDKTY